MHNKGIVVDSKTVLVSSQNWSSAGVLQNRDAGVIIGWQSSVISSYSRRRIPCRLSKDRDSNTI